MQDSASFHRHIYLSEKLEKVWKRVQRLRRGIKHPPWKIEQSTIEILPSPFKSSYNSPYETGPNEPVLSAAYSKTNENVSRSTPHTTRTLTSSTMDGAGEKWFASNRPHPVAAIFVHAGAGYHSNTNEHIHLGACRDASKMAMSILKNGDSAVAAVEAAIRVLEDKEITNAGYGSNLTIDGVVECDATIVDHMGRSGACGATAKVKNPIHLARAILEASSRPLSLRRVPPNLLVGDGATSFAWEHNVNVVPHDALVSKGARERFLKWKDDLCRANRSRLTPEASSPADSSYGEETVDLDYEERVRNQQRRDHANAILSGTWNEGQPDSPRDTPSAHLHQSEEHAEYRKYSSRSIEIDSSNSSSPSPGPSFLYRLSPILPASRTQSTRNSRDGASPTKRARYGASQSSDGQSRTHSLLGRRGLSAETSKSPVGVDINIGDMQAAQSSPQAKGTDGPTSPIESDSPSLDNSASHLSQEATPRVDPIVDEDLITDTVGAIAIDIFGNIAAGSSSGGIGMKHCGRVGPAALVGIGTAVIPLDPMDQEGIAVAAVTSGTGEHMATTMASQKCAERLYFSTRRGPGGQNIAATEEESMHSFVQDDFMDHPGVRNGHSGGAIGVMAVKKTSHGFYLHFAHNTDSFALASMHSNEKEPKCVMSRIGERGTSVVQGARKIRISL